MKLISTILLLTIVLISNGQNPVVLDNFSASESSGDVLLNWTMAKGSTCNGTEITRSTDSLNFEIVGEIEGICGDVEESVSYFFKDAAPVLNRKNYYRLEFGLGGSSDIITIEIIGLNVEGYAIFPNPITTTGRIYFSNDKGEQHELHIYNINGGLSRRYFSSTNYFDLSRHGFSSGVYLFTILAEKSDAKSGKLLFRQ